MGGAPPGLGGFPGGPPAFGGRGGKLPNIFSN